MYHLFMYTQCIHTYIHIYIYTRRCFLHNTTSFFDYRLKRIFMTHFRGGRGSSSPHFHRYRQAHGQWWIVAWWCFFHGPVEKNTVEGRNPAITTWQLMEKYLFESNNEESLCKRLCKRLSKTAGFAKAKKENLKQDSNQNAKLTFWQFSN